MDGDSLTPGCSQIDNGNQVEQQNQEGGTVVALPCNVLHLFHPQCIRMWLDKSAACPLCKHNAFTGQLEEAPAEEPIPEELRNEVN